jgi:iron complex outermembrane receptor protein
VVQNAAAATIQGVETEMRWQLSESLNVWGNLGYLDFEYDSYPTGPCTNAQSAALPPGQPCFQDLSGRVSPKAPEWNGAVGFRYNRPITDSLNLMASGTLIYSDEFFQEGDLDPRTIEPSFTKLYAQIGVSSNDGRWSVAILGKNLTDEITCHERGDVPLNDGTYSCTSDPPRTFYIQASYNY